MQDPYCLRCQPQVMGAALTILRQSAETLADEANGVTDNPLIFPGADEALRQARDEVRRDADDESLDRVTDRVLFELP